LCVQPCFDQEQWRGHHDQLHDYREHDGCDCEVAAASAGDLLRTMDNWDGFAFWDGRDWRAKAAEGTGNVSGFDVVADLSRPGVRRREFKQDSANAATGGQHSGGKL
jgi:hypothetical protein